MPMYDFRCEDCKVLVEKNVKFGEEVECPECKKTMQKSPGGMNFVLKGSGWSNTSFDRWE